MAIDREKIEEFIKLDPFRQRLEILLRKSGFTVSWVRHDQFKIWGFYLKPSKRIKEAFSIGSLEILVWVVDLDDFQARTVMRAVEVATEEKRLGKDFIIIITRDPETAKLIEKVSPQISPINIVGFSTNDIGQLIHNPRGIYKKTPNEPVYKRFVLDRRRNQDTKIFLWT